MHRHSRPAPILGALLSSLTALAAQSIPIADPIPGPIPAGDVSVWLTPVARGLNAPNYGLADPLGAGRLFVSDQSGQIWAVDLLSGTRELFLDASGVLVELGAFGPGSFDERGLLGFAFHPDYLVNGLVYTYTSEPVDGNGDFTTLPGGSAAADHQSVIREWQVPNPRMVGSVAGLGTARELLRVDQPQFNHNGGCIAFGPDGMLYIALGDGGSADDQGDGHGVAGNGRDRTNVLGTVLRIDPLGASSANGEYGIPFSNPFLGPDPGVDEIFAYGFRNPFRFSFDFLTGDLHVGDVGQNDIEEIDRVVAGGNYGWNYKEGSFFFDPNGGGQGFVTNTDPGAPAGLIDPIAEYDHDEGISVICGFVYRGLTFPELDGKLVFGDFARSFGGMDGRLLYLDGPGDIREMQIQNPTGLFVLGFGYDEDGEHYVMTNTTGVPFDGTGTVYRLDAGPTATCVFRNGSGVNPVGYSCGNQPTVGETWNALVETTAETVSTAIAVSSGDGPVVPFFGGEILVGLAPAPGFRFGVGDIEVLVPDEAALIGVDVFTQGMRVENDPGGPLLVLLNGMDLVLGS